MSLRSVAKVLAFLLLVTSAFLVLPALVALLYREPDWRQFLLAAAGGAALGGGGLLVLRDAPDLRIREGFAVVAGSWLMVGLLGAVPTWLSGQIPAFTDAAFESISGFTTTGASILTDIEGRSHATLFWRALTHWLGGMGIVVLAVAILPLLGVGGMQLFRAEVPGPTAERLTPRIRETAKLLWGVYVLLTALEVAALMLAGMGPFDAVCHSFATMATGGFSNHDASVGGYASPAVEWILIVFMLLAGTNFSLHYLALTGRVRSYGRDEEFRFYLLIIAGVTAALTALLLAEGFYGSAQATVRHALFQTVSILTTTGFGTADYLAWPPFAHAVLLMLMAVGGCAGSTGGGIKVVRLLILLKTAKLELRRMLHPRAVFTLWFNNRAVAPALQTNVLGFFLLFMVVYATGVLVLTAGGRDLVTSIGATAATLGNIGPGLGLVGPTGNYATLLDWEKWLLMAFMLIGRLELFTVLVLFLPGAWRRS
ncbi:MAG: TrkH family potassium uptake protein [Krumholzibacteria bacterium]|nr:TrkH family potassium uptake protein [Candidatus Krumholzibacteria bacterium]